MDLPQDGQQVGHRGGEGAGAQAEELAVARVELPVGQRTVVGEVEGFADRLLMPRGEQDAVDQVLDVNGVHPSASAPDEDGASNAHAFQGPGNPTAGARAVHVGGAHHGHGESTGGVGREHPPLRLDLRRTVGFQAWMPHAVGVFFRDHPLRDGAVHHDGAHVDEALAPLGGRQQVLRSGDVRLPGQVRIGGIAQPGCGVEDQRAPAGRFAHPLRIPHVSRDHLDAAGVQALRALSGEDQAAHPHPFGHQALRQPASDEPGGARHQRRLALQLHGRQATVAGGAGSRCRAP